ncbi:MAG: phosphoribosylglycinamide formyltransferase [Candidatus Diapherotrites archaeon]|nr:phosphoribosylglycinamide formyltransferase [Candidatus Diapherotrites archaeon]
MPAQIIDGKALAQKVLESAGKKAKELAKKGTVPGLAIVQIGDLPESNLYIRKKLEAAKAQGVNARLEKLREQASFEEVAATIEELNSDKSVHGIIVQLPLPVHVDTMRVLNLIAIEKDVDGCNPKSQGKLLCEEKGFAPATAKGVMKLLQSTGESIVGKKAVMVGASNIAGKPIAVMLLNAEATVTICHKKTIDLASYTRDADILVVATGNAHLIKEDMVKEGAIVIDVGINRVDGKLVGDVDFEKVKEKAGWITPVPGGVGPMTVACLIENAVEATDQQTKSKLRIGVLGSTRGTDLQAVIDAIEKGKLDAEIAIVVSNERNAYILERAKNHGIDTHCVSHKEFPTREAFDNAIAEKLEEKNVDLVLMIGFMRILSGDFCNRFKYRLMNIHPSLLPMFAGGMDTDVHSEVKKLGLKETGCTLHFVTAEVDEGPIIMQQKVAVGENDSVEDIKNKVQKAEQQAILKAIELFGKGKIVVEKNKVKILE